MSVFRCSLPLAMLGIGACLLAGPAVADQLVYVPLAQPCRLLDTRASAGGTPLTAAHGAYLFGTADADIASAAQHGNAAGCGVPASATAVSVNMNLLNATAAGNIATWNPDTGTTAPNIGTAVYNPTVVSAAAGQVQYNTGYSSIPVGDMEEAYPGKFYLKVANGQIDMTINVVGYWLPISLGETRSGGRSIAMGYQTTSSGAYSTTMGVYTTASGYYSTAMGQSTTASGNTATAMGYNTTASGAASTAIGDRSTASGNGSIAMGVHAEATHDYSFVWNGDTDVSRPTASEAPGSFKVFAPNGISMYSGGYGSGGCFMRNPGGAGWACSSDRELKTRIVPVDARAVLDKLVAMPVANWAFKTAPQYPHIGPMAQDFKAAFDLGDADDKHISSSDAQGVALAAIQGLNAKLEEKVAAKDTEIAALRMRVATLESTNRDLAEIKRQLAALRASAAAPRGFEIAQRP